MAKVYTKACRHCSPQRDIHCVDEIPCVPWQWLHRLQLERRRITSREAGGKSFLIDAVGRVLFSLHRKGFKWIDSDAIMERPWFRVRRNRSIFGKDMLCKVTLGCSDECHYKMIGFEEKSTLKITDTSGHVLAEATQKQSSEGVPLGDDVLTLVVDPNADQSLIMALVTVHGLIMNKL